jgi:NAD(P)H-hydrate epimerase
MKILTAAQMAEVDRLTTVIYHIPSMLLMENAGRSVVDEIDRAVTRLEGQRVLIFCGKGNNGGDGLVVGRYLALRRAKPEILLFGDPSQLRGDALANWEIVCAMEVPARILATSSEAKAFLRKTAPPKVIVDALFGTGLSKPIGPEFQAPVEWINRNAKQALIVAVDIPSGLFADSSAVPGAAVKAGLTVTFTALKPALVLPPAADCAGKVTVAPIGSPDALLLNPGHRMELIDAPAVRRAVPARARDSHKGTYGHLFVVAGSRGKSGAALMTGLSALRCGAGLVTLWLPKSLQRDVVGKVPELMTEFLPETKAGTSDAAGADVLLSQLQQADTLVIGPGLSQERGTRDLIRRLVQRSSVPTVLDADGINAFSSHPENLKNQAGQPVIITPHPGEMARLLGRTISSIQKNRVETAQHCALTHGCYAILKGFQTVVASPTGRVLINSTGNPGMATGGTGDILAGMVGRFTAAWYCKFHGADLEALAEYLAAAVYLHGLAGDFAATEKGEDSLIATDLLAQLPAAFKQARGPV